MRFQIECGNFCSEPRARITIAGTMAAAAASGLHWESVLGRTDRALEERNKDAARTRTEKRWGKRTLPLDTAGESINPFASDNSNLLYPLFYYICLAFCFFCYPSDWNIDRSCTSTIISSVSKIDCASQLLSKLQLSYLCKNQL